MCVLSIKNTHSPTHAPTHSHSRTHPQVIRNNNLFHGAFLFSTTHKASFVAEVRNLLATSGSLVVHMARPVLEKTITATRSLLQGVETLTSRWDGSGGFFFGGGPWVAEA